MSVEQVTVILAAAGQGERLTGSNLPKQFSQLVGTPLFIWSLSTFINSPEIGQIILTVPEEWQNKANELLEQYLPQATKRTTIIVGGNSRQESVYLALEKLAAQDPLPSYVLVHDAARPFITADDIKQVVGILKEGSACTLGITLVDSIKRVKGKIIDEDLDRNGMILMQTPQASQFKLMWEAHRHAKQNQIVTTDDAALIKSFGFPVTVVAGSAINLKITDTDDLRIAKALISHYGWSPGKVVRKELACEK